MHSQTGILEAPPAHATFLFLNLRHQADPQRALHELEVAETVDAFDALGRARQDASIGRDRESNVSCAG